HRGQEIGRGRAGCADEGNRLLEDARHAQREKGGRALIHMHPDPQPRMIGAHHGDGGRPGTRADAHVAHARPDQLIDERADEHVGDLLAIHRPFAPKAASMGRSLRQDSSNSLSASESATIPHPAYNKARSPAKSAERMATANSPSPRTSTQPTGPAYQPRSADSSSRMSARALSVGCPPMAGVGWRRSARSKMPAPAPRRARTGV